MIYAYKLSHPAVYDFKATLKHYYSQYIYFFHMGKSLDFGVLLSKKYFNFCNVEVNSSYVATYSFALKTQNHPPYRMTSQNKIRKKLELLKINASKIISLSVMLYLALK